MTSSPSNRAKELQALISDFVKNRLEVKIQDLKDIREKIDPRVANYDALCSENSLKHEDCIAKHEYSTWLLDAALRARQLKVVTHTIKPMHQQAKGSGLYVLLDKQPMLKVVSSQCLGNNFDEDLVGNAAALDVYKLLKLEFKGQRLLAMVLERDTCLAQALSDVPTVAEELLQSFAGLFEIGTNLSTHTLAKNMYWLVGNDPHEDDNFHLIAPLYASSLSHRVYKLVQSHRFSEESTAARQARKDETFSACVVHEYPHIAIQKLGGAKPQNISQLNSERRGDNILFASLPPTWRSKNISPPFGSDSIFVNFGRLAGTKATIKSLLSFLLSNPPSNVNTRTRRAEWVDEIMDQFLQFSAQIRTLPSGWSQDEKCRLSEVEKHWLDPEGYKNTQSVDGLNGSLETIGQISSLFAFWLNAQLRDPLPMGDADYLEWRNQMHELLKSEEWES
jgi:CRISPR-associated protein Csy1